MSMAAYDVPLLLLLPPPLLLLALVVLVVLVVLVLVLAPALVLVLVLVLGLSPHCCRCRCCKQASLDASSNLPDRTTAKASPDVAPMHTTNNKQPLSHVLIHTHCSVSQRQKYTVAVVDSPGRFHTTPQLHAASSVPAIIRLRTRKVGPEAPAS